MAFDPLDGSSIIDTNFAVGTIFGVWPGSRLVGVSGRELAAAGMAVYGPRTTMTIAGTDVLRFWLVASTRTSSCSQLSCRNLQNEKVAMFLWSFVL